MKYIKFLFFVLLLIFISSFCIFKACKKQNELRIRNQYDEIVKEYRENLSPEKLKKMPYEFSNETSIQDFRFGQILSNFQNELKYRGVNDFYCLEEEDFMELLTKYVRGQGGHREASDANY